MLVALYIVLGMLAGVLLMVLAYHFPFRIHRPRVHIPRVRIPRPRLDKIVTYTGLRWATEEPYRWALVLVWGAVIGWLVKIFWGLQSSRDAWGANAGDPWLMLLLGFALIWGILGGIAAFARYGRTHRLRLSRRARRMYLRAGILLGILTLLAIYLWGQVDAHNPTTPTVVVPGTTTVTEQSGVRTVGKVTYVTLTGRKDRGLQALTAQPGESYEVCLVEGHISTWSHRRSVSEPLPLWGLESGYVVTNSGRSFDWRGNYRYGNRAGEGIMPGETLVLLGQPGEEREIFQFPSQQDCLTVENETQDSLPLVLFHHGMEYGWVGENYTYPTQEDAYHYGEPGARRVSGWFDQSRDGSVAKFSLIKQ